MQIKMYLKEEISNALNKSLNNIKLQDYFYDFTAKCIVIYGAGYVGKYACDILLTNGFRPRCFLDIKGEALGSYADIPIKPPQDSGLSVEEISNSVIILCVIADSETENGIVDNLHRLGYQTIIPYQQKAFSADFLEKRNLIYSEPIMNDFRSEILSCIDLLSDKQSLEIFRKHIMAFSLRKFGDLKLIESASQYFPEDISFVKGYSKFVDCGTFDGDTLRQLIDIKGIPQEVYAFEPDLSNFYRLSREVERLNLKNAYLFPCGVSALTETLKFKSDNAYSGLASGIDVYGDAVIQCVALDDVLTKVSPTFIKMDIEGAEYDALCGARKIIARHKPDLAICVYHYVNHYFEIPLLLASWDLGYKFYLRNYDKYANETVLYATTEE